MLFINVKHNGKINIMTKFDELYSDPKSYKFFMHILHSYAKPEKILMIWDWSPDRYPNKVCSISNVELLSIKEVRATASTHFQKGDAFDWLTESMKINGLYSPKQLAIASFESRTLLAFSVYLELNNWISSKRKTDRMIEKLFEVQTEIRGDL